MPIGFIENSPYSKYLCIAMLMGNSKVTMPDLIHPVATPFVFKLRNYLSFY